MLFGAPPTDAKRAPDQKKSDETAARKKQLEENLKAMEERASGAKIRLVAKNEKSEGRLMPQPLFHYTDEPRRITDATLWGWTHAGRLVAICKIEKYDIDDPAKKWLYCFGSLAPELVETEWDWGHTWSAQKPGIEQAPTLPSCVRVACLLTVGSYILSGALTTCRPQPGLYAISDRTRPHASNSSDVHPHD
jgi:hypothetical protein